MNIEWPKSGKYIVAVSGGVDSVVLLHLLATKKAKNYQLTVAHADHGWRHGSIKDRELVGEVARAHGLPFEHTKLPQTTSESGARTARYAFLEQVRANRGAVTIITAHHADDRVETVILNLLRGTGRRGLASLQSTDRVIRPLLQVSKAEIVAYAQKSKLTWREDVTNVDTRYLRNRVRREVLPKLRKKNPDIDREIVQLSDRAKVINGQLDSALGEWMETHATPIDWGVTLPTDVLCQHSLAAVQEIIVHVARRLIPQTELDARAVAELALHIKTGRLHRPRRLSGQLFASRRYDTLTITVSHL